MQIQYFGGSCAKLSGTQQAATVLFDPLDPSTGLKLSKQQADIVLITTEGKEYNNLDAVKSGEDADPFIVTIPGEYESKGVFIYGVDVQGKEGQPNSIAYAVSLDELNVAHLGTVNRTLNEAELDHLGRIDILLVPVGGHAVLDAKKAVEVIGQIEPRIVIPILYQQDDYKMDLDPVEKFLKEFGATAETVDKLKISKKDLPAEETKVYLLSAG